MPNRPVHDIVGSTVGALQGAWSASVTASPYPALETIAAAMGGLAGSRVPDWLEPSTVGPRHRALAHDAATGLLIAKLPVAEWQATCRRLGAAHAARANTLPEDSWPQLLERLFAYIFYALAGCLGGMRAGYLSHLALDFTTPASLPLAGF